MPKKIFAVTNVKVDATPEGWFPAGSVIDRTKFTDAQLLELHEQGAIEIRTVDEEPAEATAKEIAEAVMEPTESTESTETEQTEQDSEESSME